MAKKLLQDIVKVKNNKKPVRIIHSDEEVKREKVFEKKEHSRFYVKDNSKYDTFESTENNNKSKYGLWIVALISIFFLLFAVSFLFSGAKVVVNPKTQDLNFNQSLNAIKDSTDSTPGDNLSFDLVAISGQETENIQGGEQKNVADKAKGTVVIYNAFSTSPQTLAINTRLDGSNGKTYKTAQKITVPGMDKKGIPGSVEVDVYGIEAGQEYNSDPIDFKIFSFKGTSKYSKIYARSKDSIVGGLKGNYAQISDDQKTVAVADLRVSLQSKLLKKITDQIPSGYILFKDAVFLSDDGGNTGIASADNMVPVNLNGTLYGFLFEEKALTDKIAKENINAYDGSDIYIPNIRDLNFSLLDKENISFKDVTSINFTLSGSAKIVWKVDSDKLVADLLGKGKGDFNEALSKYTNIASADLTLSPIWAMSFPDKSKDIKVIVNYPQ